MVLTTLGTTQRKASFASLFPETGMSAVSSCLGMSPTSTTHRPSPSWLNVGIKNMSFLFALESPLISFPSEDNSSVKRAVAAERRDACAPRFLLTTRTCSEWPRRSSGAASWPCRSMRGWRRPCRTCGPGWKACKTDWPVQRAQPEVKTPWKKDLPKCR